MLTRADNEFMTIIPITQLQEADMESEKPKSIKVTGIVLMVLSAFIIFSNGMGALMFIFMAIGEEAQSGHSPQTVISFVFSHYVEICLFMIVVGIIYFFGGLFIQQYKLWANRLVTVISVVQLFIVWSIMLVIRASFGQEPGLEILNILPIIVALVWKIPFGILIWFLNKKSVLNYFE
jgi:hypothetical protein